MFDYPLLDKITDIRMFACRTGNIAAGLAANSEILQCRWPITNTSGKMVLLGLKVNCGAAGTAFTPGAVSLRLGRCLPFTADGSGGTAQSLAATKTYSNGAGTDVPTLRVASTAALGAGTKTIGEDFGNLVSAVDAAQNQFVPDSFMFKADDWKIPMIFAGDEGFIVRANVPATGVWMAGFQMAWGTLPA